MSSYLKAAISNARMGLTSKGELPQILDIQQHLVFDNDVGMQCCYSFFVQAGITPTTYVIALLSVTNQLLQPTFVCL